MGFPQSYINYDFFIPTPSTSVLADAFAQYVSGLIIWDHTYSDSGEFHLSLVGVYNLRWNDRCY